MPCGKESKISAKSTSKLRFSVPTNSFYNCRESSTNRLLFLQNKANLQKSRIDVSLIATMDYGKKSNRTLGENKPKQSQSQNRSQETEDRKQIIDDKERIILL